VISEADLKFIEQFSPNQQKWARFSPDMTKRYRLGACLTPRIIERGWNGFEKFTDLIRVVFVLLNPSTATAFKPDNTFTKCVQFAQLWGADVVEIVNLFAFRSPSPAELKRATFIERGCDAINDEQIMIACRGASKVIAGWGNHGDLDDRAAVVVNMLTADGIKLWTLGTTDSGAPLHPLARGKSFIPLSRAPVELHADDLRAVPA
jgi:hypothetical protein